MKKRLLKGWLWRPLLLSLVFHGVVFWCSDMALFEESTYAVATQVAGVSLELIPGPPAAQASMLSAPPAPQAVPPPAPQVLPEPPKPEPTKKEQEFVKPKEVKKKPLPAKPQIPVAPTSPETQVASQTTTMNTGSVAPVSGPVSALVGNGQGGGSPDVRAEPDYLRNPPPGYPRESRRNGEEGTVLLSVKIGPEGEVRSLELKKSSSYSRLDEAALEAVRSWKFKPARIAGLAIESLVEVPVRFRLK